jgi:hypothetical protein
MRRLVINELIFAHLILSIMFILSTSFRVIRAFRGE